MVNGPGKRILVFTIPNDGHLNILKRFIRTYHQSHSFALVLVDQKNSSPELVELPARIYRARGSTSFVNTPAAEVFGRVAGLLDECLDIARDFRPDLVLYDFCALEGHFVGEVLGIPSWSSIPGLIGPLTDRGYLDACLASAANRDAIAALRGSHRIAIDEQSVEMISNSMHIPAERNLLWSYPSVTPRDFLANRRPAEYQFAGYLSDGHARPEPAGDTPVVYLSFGTEVMDNLWPAQEAVRVGIRRCVDKLAGRWDGFEVVFATQGRTVLDSYPGNWTVRGKVDQQHVLSRTDVFVTHGGANSFHEALLARVPVVVTPFFGDQVLIGRRAEELGVGITLTADDGIDREKSKHFLDDELAKRIDEAVRCLLAEPSYRHNLGSVPLEATPALAALT